MRLLELVCGAQAAVVKPYRSAPPRDLIGSWVRARHVCTSSNSCPEEDFNPVHPALAATLRSHVARAKDSPEGRKLLCNTFTNPVINSDFPDPSSPIVGDDGLLHVYATNSMGFNIQARSLLINPS